MIPRTIWQTYKTRDIPAPARPMVRSWVEQNPGFEHRLCDDGEIDAFMAAHFDAELVDIFRAMPLDVMRADIWRYAVLYVRGGVYADLDTRCVVPLDRWLPEAGPLVTALENDALFCQWTLAAPPGHDVLRDVLEAIRERFLQGVDTTLHRFAIHYTGPGVWTEALCRYLGHPGETASSVRQRSAWRGQGVVLLDTDAFQGRFVDHAFASIAWPEEEYPSWVGQANRTSVNGQAVPLCDPCWTSRRRGDGAVLFNAWRERSVACNLPAATVLSLCDGTRSVDGIVQYLASRLDHPHEELGRHVRGTLVELNELEVVKWKRPSGEDELHFRPEWVDVGDLGDLQLFRRIKYSVNRPEDFVPEPSLMARVGRGHTTAGRALDVGCGLGRNMRGLVETYPKWTVVGYDNPAMLARAAAWLPRHLAKIAGALRRTSLCNDWSELLDRQFELAFVSLVLQHMRRSDALKVLRDVSRITPRLVVVSRDRTDDDEDVMALIRASGCWELVEHEDDPPGSCHPGHWAGEFRSRFPISRF